MSATAAPSMQPSSVLSSSSSTASSTNTEPTLDAFFAEMWLSMAPSMTPTTADLSSDVTIDMNSPVASPMSISWPNRNDFNDDRFEFDAQFQPPRPSVPTFVASTPTLRPSPRPTPTVIGTFNETSAAPSVTFNSVSLGMPAAGGVFLLATLLLSFL